MKNISINTWLSQIETGGMYRDDILMARSIGKYNKQGKINAGYTEIKERIPVVTWNFLFNGYSKDENIISSTGYVYLDIDNPDFAINQLDVKKVFCYYKSFGGDGYSIIVRTKDVTKNNFDATYKHIASELGIVEYIDTGAIKKIQCNVLSYDPDLHYNPISDVFTAKEETTQWLQVKRHDGYNVSSLSTTCTHSVASDKKPDLPHYQNDSRTKYATKGQIFTSSVAVDYMELYMPEAIPKGKRRKTLMAYCNNFILLNPEWTQAQVLAHIMHRNTLRCKPPHNSSVVAGLVASVFKNKDKELLKPKNAKKRKVIFGTDTGYSPKEKMSIASKVRAQFQREEAIAKIKTALETTDKPTKIAEMVNMSVRSVQRYLKQINSNE